MQELLKYFPNLTEVQQSQFAQLKDLYTEWNAQINVISRKDIEELYERHVLHSLGIAKFLESKKEEFNQHLNVLDVGTGGGFPGIPLAILYPEVSFHMVDAIGKKIKVVNAVAEAIGLENILAEHARAEKLPKNSYDFIVSRAVTRMEGFLNWVKPLFKKQSSIALKNGIIYLKGGDLTEELAFIEEKELFDLSSVFSSEFFETKKVVYVPAAQFYKKK